MHTSYNGMFWHISPRGHICLRPFAAAFLRTMLIR